MYYVYILESIKIPEHFYVGYTSDLRIHLHEHNSGACRYTNMYKPWKLKAYFAFDKKEKAEHFESYLKTHSGREFQKKYL